MKNAYIYFDYPKRQTLEELIQKKVSITRCAEAIGCNRTTIYNELQRGLTKEAYAMRKYDKYDAKMAQRYSPDKCGNMSENTKSKTADKEDKGKSTEDQLKLQI